MAAIIRLKRKACDEPADGLVIALKKPKCELSVTNEVLFKFATTVNSEKDSIRNHIQAALSKEKSFDYFRKKNLKNIAVNKRDISSLRKKLHAEHQSSNEKKKLDYVNNKRLVLTEEFPEVQDTAKDAEVRQLFHLYDIIEENEDVKKQNEETENVITCNDQPLIREKVDEYVFDVYIADGHIDRTFIDETVSVRPCILTTDDIYFGDSDNSEDVYDDDDDSNDENNWRNDYPEDDSKSEEDSSDSEKDSNYDACEFDYDAEIRQESLSRAFNDFDIDEEYEEGDSRILREIRDDDDEEESEIEDEDY